MPSEKGYSKLGWILVAAMCGFLVVAALTFQALGLAPAHGSGQDPTATVVGLYLLGLVITLQSLRRGERWAWYTLWYLPVAQIASSAYQGSAIPGLVFALVFVLGQLLSYPRFFSKSGPTA